MKNEKENRMCLWVDSSKSPEYRISILDRPDWILILTFKHMIRLDFRLFSISNDDAHLKYRLLRFNKLLKKRCFITIIFDSIELDVTETTRSNNQTTSRTPPTEHESTSSSPTAGVIRYLFKSGTVFQ